MNEHPHHCRRCTRGAYEAAASSSVLVPNEEAARKRGGSTLSRNLFRIHKLEACELRFHSLTNWSSSRRLMHVAYTHSCFLSNTSCLGGPDDDIYGGNNVPKDVVLYGRKKGWFYGPGFLVSSLKCLEPSFAILCSDLSGFGFHIAILVLFFLILAWKMHGYTIGRAMTQVAHPNAGTLRNFTPSYFGASL